MIKKRGETIPLVFYSKNQTAFHKQKTIVGFQEGDIFCDQTDKVELRKSAVFRVGHCSFAIGPLAPTFRK